MLLRLLSTLTFAAKSFVLFVILAATVLGVSCFKHGDVGPYPEADYVAWLPIIAMLFVYAVEEK